MDKYKQYTQTSPETGAPVPPMQPQPYSEYEAPAPAQPTPEERKNPPDLKHQRHLKEFLRKKQAYPRVGMRSQIPIWFFRTLELLAIAIAYLQRSRIVRFISAKATLSVVVEVTDKFGAKAGHRLSTFISTLVAEPRIIAVIITAVLVIVNGIIWLIRYFGRSPYDRGYVSPGYRPQQKPGPIPRRRTIRRSAAVLGIFILIMIITSAVFYYYS